MLTPEQQKKASLPIELRSTLRTVFQLTGLMLFAVSVLLLLQKPNSVSQFIGVQDRTPTVFSIRYVGELALLGFGLLIFFIASVTNERGHTLITCLWGQIFRGWSRLPQVVRIAIGIVILLVLAGWNAAEMMKTPFTLTRQWDMTAAAYPGGRVPQVQDMIGGLQEGCLLCAKGSQPIENVTNGDDIGLFFFFGIAYKLGLVAASVPGFQQFIALSFAALIFLSALVVAIGFRSIVAGIILALLVTLLDTTRNYESLLITSYWVPAAAGMVSGSFALGLLGRAALDQNQPKPSYRFYYLVFGIWGVIAGWAFLGRSSAGPVTLLSAVVVLVALTIKFRRIIRWLPAAVLLIAGYGIVVVIFQFTLEWRITRYNLPRPIPDTVSSHPFSHAVLVGMGYVINDEGLRWDDTKGKVLAEQACPGVVYLGPEYYTCVRDIVVRIILNDPGLLIRNILAKIEALIQVTFSFFPFALLVVVALYAIRQLTYFVVFGLMLVFNTAPALLTVPYVSYLEGYFQILIILLAAAIILLGLRLVTYFESQLPTLKTN
jgi:hypothetical protein